MASFGASAHTAPDNLASTPGAACVFNAPKAVVLAGVDLGHVGWGYELPNDTWEFGANDGAKKGSRLSDTVDGHGSRATMISDFTKAASGANAYTAYKCVTVRSLNASAALQEVNREWDEVYSIPSQDCEAQAYNVLDQYGIKNMPSSWKDPSPDVWFYWLSLAGFSKATSI